MKLAPRACPKCKSGRGMVDYWFDKDDPTKVTFCCRACEFLKTVTLEGPRDGRLWRAFDRAFGVS